MNVNCVWIVLKSLCSFFNLQWLRKTDRKPLLEAVEKMKEGILHWFLSQSSQILLTYLFLFSELMLLGFISLLLTATSSIISNICIPSKFYDSVFAPCTKSEVNEEVESNASIDRKLLTAFARTHSFRRMLNELNKNTCKEACCLSKYIIARYYLIFSPFLISYFRKSSLFC